MHGAQCLVMYKDCNARVIANWSVNSWWSMVSTWSLFKSSTEMLWKCWEITVWSYYKFSTVIKTINVLCLANGSFCCGSIETSWYLYSYWNTCRKVRIIALLRECWCCWTKHVNLEEDSALISLTNKNANQITTSSPIPLHFDLISKLWNIS